jgi:oligosaccharide repeat unit polymerase
MSLEEGMPISIVATLYAITAWFMWQPKNGRRLAACVISLYGVVASCGLALFYRSYGVYKPAGFLPFFHVYVMVLIVTVPLYRFRDGCVNVVVLPKRSLFLSYLYFVGFVCLVGLLTRLPESISQAQDAFGNVYRTAQLMGSEKTGLSVVNLPLVIANAMAEIVPFLILCLLTVKNHRVLKCVLVACSVLWLVNWVGSAGRNGLIFYCINITGAIILFWNVLPAKMRKQILAVSFGLGVVLIATVVIITFSRFRDREDLPPLDSLLVYAGQPMMHFSEYVYEARVQANGDINFPLIRALLGLPYSASLAIRNSTWETQLDVPLGFFYTVVGDFILDFGVLPSLMIFMAISLFVLINTRTKASVVELHELFLIYMLFLFVIQGAFYFSYKTITGNLQIMFMICSYIFFRLTTVEAVNREKVEMNHQGEP